MLTDGHEGNGISIKGSDSPPGVTALRLDALREGEIDFSAKRYIPLIWERVARYELKAGDFLISRAKSSKHFLACTALVEKEPPLCVFPDTIIRFRAIGYLVLGDWLQSIWPSRLIRDQIEARGKTSAGIWKVSQEDLRRVCVPLPSDGERILVIDAVGTSESEFLKLSYEVESNAQRSARLRQSILAAAFSGKLVSHDPADEPASALLARIRAKRAATELGKARVAKPRGRRRRERDSELPLAGTVGRSAPE